MGGPQAHDHSQMTGWVNSLPPSDSSLQSQIGPQLPTMLLEYRVDFMVSPGSFARALPTIQTDAIPASC